MKTSDYRSIRPITPQQATASECILHQHIFPSFCFNQLVSDHHLRQNAALRYFGSFLRDIDFVRLLLGIFTENEETNLSVLKIRPKRLSSFCRNDGSKLLKNLYNFRSYFVKQWKLDKFSKLFL